jgi:hypothetical protein
VIAPKRLRDSNELPTALRGALRSLERQAPGSDVSTRVHRALEGLPPGPVHSVFTLGAGMSKPVAIAIVATLAGVGALIIQGRWSHPSPRDPATESAITPRPLSVETKEAPASEAEPLPKSPELPSVAGRRESEPGVEKGRGERIRRDRGASRGGTEGVTLAARAASREGSFVVAPADSRSAEERSAMAESGVVERSAPSAAPNVRAAREEQGLSVEAIRRPLPNAEPGPRESEAQLLYRAKRLASGDPTSALDVLESCRARFPRGALTQERDVLAIELHARLGHSATVKRLIAEFRERFPNSIYSSAIPSASP